MWGSSAYGWQYPKEDESDYRKMHGDVTDATQTLLSTGVVDRNRVAIMASVISTVISPFAALLSNRRSTAVPWPFPDL